MRCLEHKQHVSRMSGRQAVVGLDKDGIMIGMTRSRNVEQIQTVKKKVFSKQAESPPCGTTKTIEMEMFPASLAGSA